MAIKLPDLIQRVKIDAREMGVAAAKAVAFGSAMKAASRDSDDATKRMQAGLDKTSTSVDHAEASYDRLTKKVRGLRDEASNSGQTRMASIMRELTQEAERAEKAIGKADTATKGFSQRIKSIPARQRSEILTSERGAAEAAAKINFAARNRRSEIKVDVDRTTLSRIQGLLGGIAGDVSGLNFKSSVMFWTKMAVPAGFTAGIQAALPLVGALATDLIDLGKAGLVVPAGISAAAASFGTLAFSLQGLSDASDRVSKDFRNDMKSISKDVDVLQTDLRGRTLIGIGDMLKELSQTLIPELRGSLREMAEEWNRSFGRFIQFANSARFINDVKAIISGSVPVLRSFSGAVTNIVAGFLDMSVAGLPALQRISTAFEGMTKQFSDWAQRGLKDGSIARMIDEGFNAVQRLWKVVTTLGSAIGGLMKTAKDNGISFIGTLQNIADWMDSLFNNPFVQKGLASAFQGVSALVDGIFRSAGPFKQIFGDIGFIVGDVGKSLGSLFRTALPYVSQALSNLRPAISGVLQFMTPFNSIINAIGPAFVRATATLSPFIQRVTELGRGVIQTVAPLIAKIANTIADMLPGAIAAVTPILEGFAAGIRNLVPILSSLVDILRPVAELIIRVAGAMGGFIAPWAPAALAVLGLVKALTALRALTTGVIGTIAGQFAPIGAVGSRIDVARVALGNFRNEIALAGGGMRGFATAAGGVASRGLAAGFSAIASAINPVTLAIAAATAGLLAWVNAQANAQQATEMYLATLDKVTGAATGATKQGIFDAIMGDLSPSDVTLLQNFGVSMTEATNAAAAGGTRLENYRQKIRDLAQSIQLDASPNAIILKRALEGLDSTLGNQSEVLQDAVNKWKAASTAQKELAAQEALSQAASAAMAAATQSQADAAANAAQKEQALKDAIQARADLQAQQNNTLREVFEAQQEVNRATAAGAKGLNFTTEAGVRNTRMMDRLILAQKARIQEMIKEKGTTPAVIGSYDKIRAGLIDTATQFTHNRKKAQEYVDKLLGIPVTKKTRVDAATGAAKSAIQSVIDKLNGIHNKSVVVTFRTVGLAVLNAATAAARAAAAAASTYRTGALNADGGLYRNNIRYFGSGGHETHVAQHAAAGQWRIWAEPETGGESYIPHAPAKRQRSRQIWAETGAYLGFDRSRLNAILAMAEGGVLSAGPPVTQRPAIVQTQMQTARTRELVMIKGVLSLDASGNAYIRGIAQEVVDGNSNTAATFGRMRG